MRLWVDSTTRTYGLEAEPGFSDQDSKAEEFTLGESLKINATPTLVFTDGTIVPGALPVAQIEKQLADAEAEAKKLAAASKP